MKTFRPKSTPKKAISTPLFKSILPDYMRSHTTEYSNQASHKKYSIQNSSLTLSRKKTLKSQLQHVKTQIIIPSKIWPTQQHKPLINGICALRVLQDQTDKVSQLFTTLSKIRQHYGVLYVNCENLNQGNVETHEIPYHAQLHQMNRQISKIRTQIQNRMTKIFKVSKICPKIPAAIENLLEKYSLQTLKQNQKYAKIAAMKAQQRLLAFPKYRYSKTIKH